MAGFRSPFEVKRRNAWPDADERLLLDCWETISLQPKNLGGQMKELEPKVSTLRWMHFVAAQ